MYHSRRGSTASAVVVVVAGDDVDSGNGEGGDHFENHARGHKAEEQPLVTDVAPVAPSTAALLHSSRNKHHWRSPSPPEEVAVALSLPPPPLGEASTAAHHWRRLKRRYATKVHAYAVPAYSYYVPQAMMANANSTSTGPRFVNDGSRSVSINPSSPLLPHARSNSSSSGLAATQRRRMLLLRRRQPPRRLAGRLTEQQRYQLPRCPPYRIPLYDQACFKYIFPNLFRNARRRKKLEMMQLLFLCMMLFLAAMNIVATVVNVFFNDPVGDILPWARAVGRAVFALEFAIVVGLSLLAAAVIVHAVVVNRRGRPRDEARLQGRLAMPPQARAAKEEAEEPKVEAGKHMGRVMRAAGQATDGTQRENQQQQQHSRRKNGLVIGTSDLAQDVAALVTVIGTFSVLRVIGLASPSFAFRRILPIFRHAATGGALAKGIFLTVLWVIAVFLAFLILIAKVTQIDFAFTKSFGDWNIVNHVQLAGIMFNLARVDDSYYKETSVLLDAVHQHFSPPGTVMEYHSGSGGSGPLSPPTSTTSAYSFDIEGAVSGGGKGGRAGNESAAGFSHPFSFFGSVVRGAGTAHGADRSGTDATADVRHHGTDAAAESLPLLSRLLKALHVPPFMYFTYFDVMYDYQFNAYEDRSEKGRRHRRNSKGGEHASFNGCDGADAARGDEDGIDDHHHNHHLGSLPPMLATLPARTHAYNFFNYLSFIFEIDNVQLRRYLHMVHSPLPFYRLGRDAFDAAFIEKDIVGMDMALWRSDPTLRATQLYARRRADQFDMRFVCEDRREVWDARYEEWAEERERRGTLRMARDVGTSGASMRDDKSKKQN